MKETSLSLSLNYFSPTSLYLSAASLVFSSPAPPCPLGRLPEPLCCLFFSSFIFSLVHLSSIWSFHGVVSGLEDGGEVKSGGAGVVSVGLPTLLACLVGASPEEVYPTGPLALYEPRVKWVYTVSGWWVGGSNLQLFSPNDGIVSCGSSSCCRLWRLGVLEAVRAVCFK
ncbi:hypothetical protein IGI04_029617, partial [Brassica rapa subsp. trilocularis]